MSSVDQQVIKMIVSSLSFAAFGAFRTFSDVISWLKCLTFHFESLHFQHWRRFQTSSVDQQVIKIMVCLLLFAACGAFRVFLHVISWSTGDQNDCLFIAIWSMLCISNICRRHQLFKICGISFRIATFPTLGTLSQVISWSTCDQNDCFFIVIYSTWCIPDGFRRPCWNKCLIFHCDTLMSNIWAVFRSHQLFSRWSNWFLLHCNWEHFVIFQCF
jgi:hypothetical protein